MNVLERDFSAVVGPLGPMVDVPQPAEGTAS